MTPEQIVARFPSLSVLVVGDICLDRWCYYDPSQRQPSAETGIPRLAVTSSEVTPGAGGTVANNLSALGVGHVAVLGVCGTDGHATELEEALAARGIDASLLVRSTLVPTFTYTKIINSQTGVEDQPRLDFIPSQPLPAGPEQLVLDRLAANAPRFDVIIVADQAETATGGVITAAVRRLLARLAVESPAKVIWVDSRERLELFSGVTVKPNLSEAQAACARLSIPFDPAALRARINAPLLLITRGPGGVEIHQPSHSAHVPTAPVENPVDICGAGDSFSAAAAITLSVSSDPLEAARFGNAAASVTIMKKGTGTASSAELLQALDTVTSGC